MKHLPGNRIVASRLALLIVLALHRPCGSSVLAADDPVPPVPVPIASDPSYADAVEAHMGYVTEYALDEYGAVPTPMWLATIDIQTSRLPDPAVAGDSEGNRSALPLASSNLYLDQPTIVAAYELARRTGCKCYSDAANRYTDAFLKAGKQGSDGDFSLQAARYYDVIRDELVTQPLPRRRRSIHLPAWETVWLQDPQATERAIRAIAIELIEARQAATSRPDLASPDLAQHAIVLDSLCWLASKKKEPQGELYRMARQVTAKASTSGQPVGELGIWAESLIRASRATGSPAFQDQASQILNDYLEQSFDAATGRYIIKRPIAPHRTRPGATFDPEASTQHATVFDPPRFFDNRRETAAEQPMPLAEACLSLWEASGHEAHRQATIRWAEAIRASVPANAGHGASAEDYGRAIHFLVRTAETLRQPQWRDLALELADDAMDHLYEPNFGMFRSRVGEDRCDAIDGPGFLLLALLYLDGPDPTAHSALHF